MLVQQFLETSALRRPDKAAVVCNGARLSYREVNAMANRLAHALADSGVSRGDRVAIHLANSIEAVVAIFAALKTGGVFVVIHPTTKRDKLAYILNNCGARALITDAHAASGVIASCPAIDLVIVAGDRTTSPHEHARWLSFDAVQTAFPDTPLPCRNIDLDLACLIYTSGSTGEPKGVMSDHSNVVFASASIMEYLQNSETDIVINVLPLSFDYGLYQLLMTFRFGGTLVLEKSFVFPAEVLKRIEEERVTGFPGVPTMFALLMQTDLSAFDLSSLRYVTNTAAALPPSHIQELRRKLPDVKLYSMYGLTETKRTLYLPPEELDRRPGSVGIAIPGTEVWLEDEFGNRVQHGEIGELIVRGRHVMRGYWRNPEATAHRYGPGPIPGERVCRTGDLFRADSDGYFYFVARKDDIIKCRGEKVAPKEIENALFQMKGVVEAAVIGVPDPILGQAIKALLVVDGRQPSVAEVRAHCQAHLEDFMVPKYVEFCSELPKTSSGKIARMALSA